MNEGSVENSIELAIFSYEVRGGQNMPSGGSPEMVRVKKSPVTAG